MGLFVTLYGYAREPDSTDAEGDPPPEVPYQRATSAPVAVLGTPARSTSDVLDQAPGGDSSSVPDLRVPPPPVPPQLVRSPPVPPPPGLPLEPPVPAEPTSTVEADAASLAPVGLSLARVGPTGSEPRYESGYPGSPESVAGLASAGVSPSAPDELPVRQSDHVWAAPAEDDADDIVPWDRRPLMVVIAGGVVLVVLAILSGMTTAQIFAADPPPAAWRGVQTPSVNEPGPTGAPGVGSGVDGTITLSGVGDVIMGTQPRDLPPNGGAGFFDAVRDALAADVVMGNLETPLTVDTGRVKCQAGTPTTGAGTPSPTSTKASGCFQFFLPPSYANPLHAGGFTVMNLANNHTFDMGPEGLVNTRKALEAASVQHTGAPNEITYVDVKGVRVAVLGFAIYSWGQNLNNIPAAVDLVRRADAAADLVVIQMQGGAEGADKTHVRPGKELYLGEDRGDLVKFSHAVIDAGADVIFGHGPHVMRGMEFYKGRLIAYSLGNFAGYGVLSSAGVLGVSGVLKVTLNKDGSWAGGRLVATELAKGGLPAPDPKLRALSFVNGLSKEDFGAAAATVSATDGAIGPPAA